MKIAFSISEVINITGIGRTKLYELIGSNAIPAKKIGKKTVILRADLENFLINLDPFDSQPSKD